VAVQHPRHEFSRSNGRARRGAVAAVRASELGHSRVARSAVRAVAEFRMATAGRMVAEVRVIGE
jgi:hypothetical protein